MPNHPDLDALEALPVRDDDVMIAAIERGETLPPHELLALLDRANDVEEDPDERAARAVFAQSAALIRTLLAELRAAREGREGAGDMQSDYDRLRGRVRAAQDRVDRAMGRAPSPRDGKAGER